MGRGSPLTAPGSGPSPGATQDRATPSGDGSTCPRMSRTLHVPDNLPSSFLVPAPSHVSRVCFETLAPNRQANAPSSLSPFLYAASHSSPCPETALLPGRLPARPWAADSLTRGWVAGFGSVPCPCRAALEGRLSQVWGGGESGPGKGRCTEPSRQRHLKLLSDVRLGAGGPAHPASTSNGSAPLSSAPTSDSRPEGQLTRPAPHTTERRPGPAAHGGASAMAQLLCPRCWPPCPQAPQQRSRSPEQRDHAQGRRPHAEAPGGPRDAGPRALLTPSAWGQHVASGTEVNSPITAANHPFRLLSAYPRRIPASL